MDVRLNGGLDIAVQVVASGVWKLHRSGARGERRTGATKAGGIQGRQVVRWRLANDGMPAAAAVGEARGV